MKPEKIAFTFEVHNAKDELEADKTILELAPTMVAKANDQLEAEGKKIRLSVPK